jgi:hypothetical protein
MTPRLVKTETFEHEGKNYDLKLFSDGWTFTVKSFREGREANGYSYAVVLPTAFDLNRVTGMDAVRVLFDNARNDIRERNWERYVEAYLASLNLKEDEGAACVKCTGRDIQIRIVDGRKMYRCATCGNIWYQKRSTGGGNEVILDAIADGVVENSYHEIDVLILLNVPFREYSGGPSFDDQLRNWCNQNHLGYDVFHQKDRRGKDAQLIRFTRKPA